MRMLVMGMLVIRPCIMRMLVIAPCIMRMLVIAPWPVFSALFQCAASAHTAQTEIIPPRTFPPSLPLPLCLSLFPPSPTPQPTDPVPAGPRTRHLARKLGILDGQNTLGPHTPPPSPSSACENLMPQSSGRACVCVCERVCGGGAYLLGFPLQFTLDFTVSFLKKFTFFLQALRKALPPAPPR